MPSSMDAAFASLTTAFQAVTGSTPVISYSGQDIPIIPGSLAINSMFVDGGTANGAQLTVMTRESLWTTIPPKLAVVTISGHANGSGINGTYQVLAPGPEHREGTVTFTLGNVDAQ